MAEARARPTEGKVSAPGFLDFVGGIMWVLFVAVGIVDLLSLFG